MKIIDTHCHVYPERIAVKAAEATGNFYGIPARENGCLKTLMEKGAQAGISHYVINSVATTPAQVHSINTFISGAVKDGNGIFTGMGALHPESEDQEKDVLEIISLGLKGIKLHPDIQRFQTDSKKAMEMFALAQHYKLPVCVHLGDSRYDNSNPDRIKPVLEAFPDLLIIGAHFGGWSIWEEAANELYRYDNIIVDCSSSLYAMSPEKARELIDIYGVNRVMFGTDYPLWTPKEEVERFMKIPLGNSEREAILCENAKKLFGINI